MKPQIIKQIFFWCVTISLLTSCTSITKNFPKQPRPFQVKEFNSEQWKSGDYQTRGEMAENLRESAGYPNPWKKSAEEVRQILGKPDVITQADCCNIGRSVSPEKVEVWLYYIEIEEGYRNFPAEGEPKKKILQQAFKLYFPKLAVNSLTTVIGKRDGDHSLRMPVVGAIRF
jgi:hypothetical protein